MKEYIPKIDKGAIQKKIAKKQKGLKKLGNQVLGEFYGCKKMPSEPKNLEVILLKCAKVMRATVVKSVFHKFNPHGLSGVLVIAESHIAIHTWPEFACIAIDIFTCGKINTKKGLNYLKTQFRPQKSEIFEIARGRVISNSA